MRGHSYSSSIHSTSTSERSLARILMNTRFAHRSNKYFCLLLSFFLSVNLTDKRSIFLQANFTQHTKAQRLSVLILDASLFASLWRVEHSLF
ncbi:hypothetical protein CPB83DRAFT_864703, partial [Crepidotus variabilis]